VLWDPLSLATLNRSGIMESLPAAPDITDRLLAAMRRYWGYDSFLPLQQEAMSAVLCHRDSVVVLPTGGGKSLCFQVPAVCSEGLAVVVSPLISLMKDQVDALRACGVPAAAIHSALPAEERAQIARQVRGGELKLLYVAPERLLMPRTLHFLADANVSLFAIDEAHCISGWGHDFRPEYRGLRALKERFPQVGVHAYTATASEKVQRDIADQLGQVDPRMLVGSFDRPNLIYRAVRASSRASQVQQLVLARRGDSGIVYCISRREVDDLSAILADRGIRALPYHAGLSDATRHRNQEAFLEEEAEVVVATVAFGMGIDKSNVRYVIHAGMPKSVENYMQESGRAGRDGLEADCILLYSGRDPMTWRRMIEGGEPSAVEGALKSLDAMWQFCTGVACRHRTLVEYFGQELGKTHCGACDVCLGEVDLLADALIVGQKILSCVARLDQRYGADYTAKVLVGSQDQRILAAGHDRLSTHGLLHDQSIRAVRDWIEQLVGQGFLRKVGEYHVLEITETGWELIRGNLTPQLAQPTKGTADRRRRETPADSWEGVDKGLFDQLRKLRSELAGIRGVPPYVVFGDAALRDMARQRPTTEDGFLLVKGVGEKKRSDYGEAFLNAITNYCQTHDLATDITTGAASALASAPTPATASATRAPQRRTDGAHRAFELFRQGTTITDAATQLGRARSTVVGYLGQYLGEEGVMDPSPWVDPAIVAEIEAAIEVVGADRLRPIYEHLEQQVDYDSIRIVVTCVNNRDTA
jgi:ATP-dependent DNA helicase RecQ